MVLKREENNWLKKRLRIFNVYQQIFFQIVYRQEINVTKMCLNCAK